MPFAATLYQDSTETYLRVLDRLLSVALVGVSGRVIQSNSEFFFLFLFQSEFSTSIPWEQGCRMGGTNILSVSQNEDEKDQCYFPP